MINITLTFTDYQGQVLNALALKTAVQKDITAGRFTQHRTDQNGKLQFTAEQEPETVQKELDLRFVKHTCRSVRLGLILDYAGYDILYVVDLFEVVKSGDIGSEWTFFIKDQKGQFRQKLTYNQDRHYYQIPGAAYAFSDLGLDSNQFNLEEQEPQTKLTMTLTFQQPRLPC